jgi:DNA-binding MurR/RpiR family transcriptional regulator
MDRTSSIPEQLRARFESFTRAEQRVARALLAAYPTSGLDSLARLADRAGVSSPTVLRLVYKLGYSGYPEFQDALKVELGERLSSPLLMYSARAGRELPLDKWSAAMAQGILRTFEQLPAGEFERVVALLSDERRPVYTIGGRFSGVMASYLTAHLQLLRPHVTTVLGSSVDHASYLLDLSKRDVIVAFDYRRYDRTTIRFCRLAARQGGTVVLFTDPWLSPIASVADVVLSASIDAPSPFDSYVPAFALVEGLIAGIVGAMGTRPTKRMGRYDALVADPTVGGDEASPE